MKIAIEIPDIIVEKCENGEFILDQGFGPKKVRKGELLEYLYNPAAIKLLNEINRVVEEELKSK